jgi:hypothetical protein
VERHPLAAVQVQLGNRAAAGVDDELEAAGRARERLVAERRDELVLPFSCERAFHDDGHVDVAASVHVAAERARSGEVDADEVVAEQPTEALDQLVEVRR